MVSRAGGEQFRDLLPEPSSLLVFMVRKQVAHRTVKNATEYLLAGSGTTDQDREDDRRHESPTRQGQHKPQRKYPGIFPSCETISNLLIFPQF